MLIMLPKFALVQEDELGAPASDIDGLHSVVPANTLRIPYASALNYAINGARQNG
jgi:hypothetical protein